MHFVDDIHPHFHLRRRIDRIIPEVTDIVNTVVRGGVDLQHIHTGARIDGLTGLADIAGIAVVGI